MSMFIVNNEDMFPSGDGYLFMLSVIASSIANIGFCLVFQKVLRDQRLTGFVCFLPLLVYFQYRENFIIYVFMLLIPTVPAFALICSYIYPEGLRYVSNE